VPVLDEVAHEEQTLDLPDRPSPIDWTQAMGIRGQVACVRGVQTLSPEAAEHCGHGGAEVRFAPVDGCHIN
jgi:hypothetical protein